MEGDAGTSRLNPTDADDSPESEAKAEDSSESKAVPKQKNEDSAVRPAMVTAAAMFAFIVAGMNIVAGLSHFVIGGFDKPAFGPLALIYGVIGVNLVFAVVMVLGGIVALQGTTNKLLVYSAVALAVQEALQTLLSAIYRYAPPIIGAVGVAIAVFLIWSLMTPKSQEFFGARGGSVADRRAVVLAGITVPLLALAGGLGVGGYLALRSHHQSQAIARNNAAALKAAMDCIAATQAPDINALAEAERRIVECGTDEYRSQALMYSSMLMQAYQAANAHVQVVDNRAAVERDNPNGSVNVLVALRVRVTNSTAQNQEVGYRLRVTMTPTEGQYKVSRVESVTK